MLLLGTDKERGRRPPRKNNRQLTTGRDDPGPGVAAFTHPPAGDLGVAEGTPGLEAVRSIERLDLPLAIRYRG